MPHSVNTRQCPIRIEERSDISVILLTIFIFLEESVLLEGLLALYILMDKEKYLLLKKAKMEAL